MNTHRLKEYLRAVRGCPEGVVCAWCWRPNFFFDDMGFWCINPRGVPGGLRVCCEHCFRGPLGEAHIARYGQGER